MLNRILALFCAAVALVSLSSPAKAADAQTLTITMKALNGSGENGKATISQVQGGVLVTVTLDNGAGQMQPTHIHAGTCGNINLAPEYPLHNTVDGKSTTVLPGLKISDLLSNKYAINVHKSADDLATYVSCGNIM